MVHVKGIWRLLTHRFSKDLDSRVKYSTLCPSRMDSPSEARRAIPTRRGFSGTDSRGREDIAIRLLFAHHMRAFRLVSTSVRGSIYREKFGYPLQHEQTGKAEVS